MKLKNYFFLAIAICIFWILLTYTIIHWSEGPSDDVRVRVGTCASG